MEEVTDSHRQSQTEPCFLRDSYGLILVQPGLEALGLGLIKWYNDGPWIEWRNKESGAVWHRSWLLLKTFKSHLWWGQRLYEDQGFNPFSVCLTEQQAAAAASSFSSVTELNWMCVWTCESSSVHGTKKSLCLPFYFSVCACKCPGACVCVCVWDEVDTSWLWLCVFSAMINPLWCSV